VAAQPTGTVTLLFTDIEGSTRLLERLGTARYGDALELHRDLLRNAFEQHGGYEVDCEGDAFFVAFASAQEAVAAAADVQRALAAATWPAEGAIRVRMGLHTGEPLAAPPNYVGMDVHKAARIMAAGHGGQVLLSEATVRLLDGVDTVSLGEHRLKDLLDPVPLHQLRIEGLAGDFPPPRTLENRPTNLPTQPTPFLGRERELAELLDLLTEPPVRLLTLTGPGGTGKTRLALQLAAEVVERFPQGVYLVTLAPVTDPELVLPTIAQTLGVRDEGDDPAAVALGRELREKELLLLLDNFEHLESAAPVVAQLLAGAPGLKVLATSRAPLHLAAEHEYQVAPLEEIQALELFAERARAVLPGFALNGNREPVLEICRRLDHLPLAVELAAARVKLLPPPALLARLEQRLRLLTGGARDRDDRQRTLRAAIDWSYDLLDDDERVLFRRLAVFTGGWTLDVAEAVCAPDGELDVLDGLASLLDKSLVRHSGGDDEPRYSMLQTIREYALELLEDSGEADEVRARHAAAFLELGEQVHITSSRWADAEHLDRLQPDEGNLRAALEELRHGDATLELRLALALGWFWEYRGNVAEVQALLESALDRLGEGGPPDLRMRALDRLAFAAYRRGSLTVAREASAEALSIAQELGDEAWIVKLLTTAGTALRTEGDLGGARALTEEALERAQRAGLRQEEMAATVQLGDLALYEGDFPRTRALFEQSRAIALERGEALAAAHSLWNIAVAALHEGEIDVAGRLFAEAFATFREEKWPEGLAYGLEGLAAAAARGGEAERGARLLGAAEACLEETGMSFDVFEQAMHDWTVELLREELGEERFHALLDEGVSLGVGVADVQTGGVMPRQ
jgi:predicted ATPase/class 3 adenylate cyclase